MVKPANIVFYADKIIFECPYCGRTLIRSNFEKIRKLLEHNGPPAGKLCEKCGETASLILDRKAKEYIRSKLPESAG